MTTSLRQLSGKRIGPYELRELYGIGGMGAVYRAYHQNLDRDVGFKVMSLSYAAQTEFKERFEREAKLAASLEHPHIVPIYDYAALEDWQYVVMRLLTGGSLAERIDQMKGKPPSLNEISALLQQLASALDYAHSRNIVHRDIKSNNIMFDTHGTAYIVDFGIAKLILDNSTRLTAEGMTIGTPTHMAPELWSGEDASAASDQYALAIVIYELLTGRVPFNATSPFALMNRHVTETPEPVQKYAPQLSSEFDMILWRALSKDRYDRYPTTMAFAKDFASVAQRTPHMNTGIFTMELRRELLNSETIKPVINNTPVFPDTPTITPAAMSAPPAKKAAPEASNAMSLEPPAFVPAKNRTAIKSLSAPQKQAAPIEASIPSALPKKSAVPDAPQAKPKVANSSQSKTTTPLPFAEAESVGPVKERVIIIESKAKPTPRTGLAQAIVDSIFTLFGIKASSAVRASIAMTFSAVFTVVLIVGIGFGIFTFLSSPAVGDAVKQFQTSLASIGSQASDTAQQSVQQSVQQTVQQNAQQAVQQGVQQNLPQNLPPPPPGGGFPPPPRR